MKNKFDIGYFIIYCLSSVVFILIFLLLAVVLRRHGYDYFEVIPITYIFSAVFFFGLYLFIGMTDEIR